MDKEQTPSSIETQQLSIVGASSNTLNNVECPYCQANGLQIEFEHYEVKWKEYRCKVCNRRFMCK
jgi:transposase-like protein